MSYPPGDLRHQLLTAAAAHGVNLTEAETTAIVA
jgi:hypothetical protein